MFIRSTEEIVWTPLYGGESQLIGSMLRPEFTRECIGCEIKDPRSVSAYVWPLVRLKRDRPEPSEWIRFYKDTLLVTFIYMPIGAASGKWLECEEMDVMQLIEHPLDNSRALTYSLHHASDMLDDYYNRWLMFVFATWAHEAVRTLRAHARTDQRNHIVT